MARCGKYAPGGKIIPMPSRRVAGTYSLAQAKKDIAGIDAEKKESAIKEARAKRAYRSKSVRMDIFFKARRNAEIACGLVVGLDRSVSLVHDGALIPRSYFLFINGVSARFETIQEATAYLNGYSAAVCAGRDPEKRLGDIPCGGETVSHVMGAKAAGVLIEKQ